MTLRNEYRIEACPTIEYVIHIGGPKTEVESILAKYAAKNGVCFSVTEQTYIYTGGREAGVAVRLINYARFPTTDRKLASQAGTVARLLMEELGQGSCSIVGPAATLWLSRRQEDEHL